MKSLNRREFIKQSLKGTAILSGASLVSPIALSQKRRKYRGPKVVLVRFGGGVRRQEVLNPKNTYAPFFLKKLAPNGTLFSNMKIVDDPVIETSHGQGTLHLLTGVFHPYQDIENKPLASRFEAKVPTLPEYLRKQFDIPMYQTLLINSEDRQDEEYYNFSNHSDYGESHRSITLSLFRYKMYLNQKIIEENLAPSNRLNKAQKELEKAMGLDRRVQVNVNPPMVNSFWKQWRNQYGDSGFKNPRGDRLLTELAIKSFQNLRPIFTMINYTDPDYVHWGNPSHYFQGISIIDQELQKLVHYLNLDPFYRGQTILAVVPDCGRDNNPNIRIPYQHHFKSKESRKIFALFWGAGIAKNREVKKETWQKDIAPTIGHLMGMKLHHSDGSLLNVKI